MKRIRNLSGFLCLCLVYLAACSRTPLEPASISTAPVRSTSTIPPTASPTHTLVPPTPFPLPQIPSSRGQPATHSVCAAGCDFTTIQAAIDETNTDNEVVIEILDPIHTEADINLNRDITLRGLGENDTILQAHDDLDKAPGRVFLVEREVTVVIEALTIRHGKPGTEDENGGGIRNFGKLTLRNCTVSNNRANGGGGISNSGDLTLIDSTVRDNLADGIASMGLECGNGGGIQSGSGTLMLLNSTVSGNQAGLKGRARGGGLHIGCGCKAVIINSTVSGNEASRESGRAYAGGNSCGGGIYIAGELQLVSSTVSDNRAGGKGGGIYIGKRLDYMNSIISNNVGEEGNCVVMTSGSEADAALIGMNLNNLVEDGGCDSSFTGDPLLETLGANGGSTETHALQPDSPAIDAVPASFCTLEFDQRGQPRTDSNGGNQAYCDIGAFEYQP